MQIKNIAAVTEHDANGRVVAVARYAGIPAWSASATPNTTAWATRSRSRPLHGAAFDPAHPDLNVQSISEYNAAGYVLTRTAFANVPALAQATVTQYDDLGRAVRTIQNYTGSGDFDPKMSPTRTLSR